MTAQAEPGTEVSDTPLESEYRSTRQRSEWLCEPLSEEDMCVQAMPDASPSKWHLAHTTWFFECFILEPHLPGYQQFHPQFSFLFNSYYNTIGERQPRPRRGLLTRPSFSEVLEYRHHVDRAMETLWPQCTPDVTRLATIGLHHEQQHQELLLTDILYLFSQNPLFPAYRSAKTVGEPNEAESHDVRPSGCCPWTEYSAVRTVIGHSSESFCYDNEQPPHEVEIRPYRLNNRLVTNTEFLEFMNAGGYQTPHLWLSDGWDVAQRNGWRHPLHWREIDGNWSEFTLRGLVPIRPHAPVCHISFYEADAYARWRGHRLPTEYEWEHAAAGPSEHGCLFEDLNWMSRESRNGGHGMSQLIGDAWEWTGSPYLGYPGYRPDAGALGEYNGKFMCNQFVLRGGSCVTPSHHIRSTYRNFFPPDSRWQFMSFRLADDAC